MIRAISSAAALAAGSLVLAAAPTAAQSVAVKAIEAKHLGTKAKIDPAKAYILISAPRRAQGTFIKTPDADDIAAYRADWDKAFAKAQKKYASDLKGYELEVASVKTSGVKPRDKPVEPTRESFSIGDIERRLTASYGPMFAFEKTDADTFSYVMEVEPGTYSYYGPIYVLPNGGAVGACYCMGSVKFEAKAGIITNLGDFLSGGWVSDEALRQTAAVLPEMPERTPTPASYPVPAALAGYTVVTADWRAADKMNNFYGITVQRMPPVEGVLAYDRDKVIDLKATP